MIELSRCSGKVVQKISLELDEPGEKPANHNVRPLVMGLCPQGQARHTALQVEVLSLTILCLIFA